MAETLIKEKEIVGEAGNYQLAFTVHAPQRDCTHQKHSPPNDGIHEYWSLADELKASSKSEKSINV